MDPKLRELLQLDNPHPFDECINSEQADWYVRQNRAGRRISFRRFKEIAEKISECNNCRNKISVASTALRLEKITFEEVVCHELNGGSIFAEAI